MRAEVIVGGQMAVRLVATQKPVCPAADARAVERDAHNLGIERQQAEVSQKSSVNLPFLIAVDFMFIAVFQIINNNENNKNNTTNYE